MHIYLLRLHHLSWVGSSEFPPLLEEEAEEEEAEEEVEAEEEEEVCQA